MVTLLCNENLEITDGNNFNNGLKYQYTEQRSFSKITKKNIKVKARDLPKEPQGKVKGHDDLASAHAR